MQSLFKAFSTMLMAVLLLTGCNQVGLAYRNLDVIIPWTLSDYLDMSSDQKSWLDVRLKQHLSWHCSTQLPEYLTWLDKLEEMVKSDQVTYEGLQARTNEAKQAIATISREITPSAVELLARFDDKQVQEMQNAFAKDQRKRENKYLDQPLERQIAERADRMEKRLTPWIGKLNQPQKDRIQAWSASLGEQNKAWIENRTRWQNLFLAAVQQRQSSDFAQRIGALLQDRETFWTPEYRKAYDQTEKAAISLIVDVTAQSTQEQRDRLLSRIADMRKDFTDLNCLKSAGAAR
ncbi:hypothetical protein SAMN05216593_114122 [Pseudomonas asturiensis]|uniref:Lipoprotein n=1 Tax=Pseudomonas asturiensis TaxID=1190415 RepID=A0A1M7PX64_9PSED|nr:DUF6279 family lipoprotein [Pseudomonas asturiensis]SHN22150.1 hypothetical protein SAMN05216593_114122 [Pseudomonas asturiensis]